MPLAVYHPLQYPSIVALFCTKVLCAARVVQIRRVFTAHVTLFTDSLRRYAIIKLRLKVR